jgi:hypothetical protein
MKLKDYLHYYLFGNIWEAGVTTCTLMGIGDSYYTIKTKQGTMLTLSNRADIKPLLRRLEDMTEGQARDFLKYANPGAEYITHNEHAVIWQSQGSRSGLFFLYGPPSGFHYLLTQHFDLFGLIDAGLAVDAKTATP